MSDSLIAFYQNKKSDPFDEAYDYDEKGNLIVRDKNGQIINQIMLPTYRPVTIEELAAMEKERLEKINEANMVYEDTRKQLHNAIHNPQQETNENIMQLNKKVREADASLIYASFGHYNVTTYGVSHFKHSDIDYSKLDEHRKYPYEVYIVGTRKFQLQDQYVRIDQPAENSEIVYQGVITRYKDKTVLRKADTLDPRPTTNRGKVYIAAMNLYGARAEAPPNTKILNVTSSQGSANKDRRDFSPMTESNYKGYYNFEAFWQSGKKWEGIPLETSKKWWKNIDKQHRKYPHGKKVEYSQWGKMDNDEWEIEEEDQQMGYVESRKKVYVPLYHDYMQVHERTAYWEKIVDSGQDVVVYDFDGPRLNGGKKPSEDPPTMLEVTVEMLREKINYERNPFGHGYVVAAHLAGIPEQEYNDEYKSKTIVLTDKQIEKLELNAIELEEPDADAPAVILFDKADDEKYGFLSIYEQTPLNYGIDSNDTSVIDSNDTSVIGEYTTQMMAAFEKYDKLKQNNMNTYYTYDEIFGDDTEMRQKWIKYSEIVLYNIYYDKFKEHPHLKEKLNATGNAVLGASMGKDDILGIGETDLENPEEWKGLNLVGKTLMKLRDEFRIASKKKKARLLEKQTKGLSALSTAPPNSSVAINQSETERKSNEPSIFNKMKKALTSTAPPNSSVAINQSETESKSNEPSIFNKMKKALIRAPPPKSVKSIKGLYYIPNVIKDGKAFINELDKRTWSSVSDSAQSRRVQHYGYQYDYVSRRVGEQIDPIPDALLPLQKILTEICLEQGLIDETYVFNQCIVNEYKPGQGISKHVDHKAYGKVIGCFTLGSGASMVFRKGADKESVYVEKDSLYIMSGEARNDWTHELPERTANVVDGTAKKRGRRISVTFREIKKQ